MYFYAFTDAGWDNLRADIVAWMQRKKGRRVTLFAGTDHAITGPDAIRRAKRDGVQVWIPVRHRGVFHPKVMWLKGRNAHSVWVGSNNLTRDGLEHNVEFAVLLKSRSVPRMLQEWARKVESASDKATEKLLRSYENQRKKFEKNRAEAKATTFTWRERTEPDASLPLSASEAGDLILEVMPKETGAGGRQLQLPTSAAREFFGLGRRKSTRISLRRLPEGKPRPLTMTVFGNNTVRLTIRDLEYRDRPCVMRFRREAPSRFAYDIVPESIFPRAYRKLLGQCTTQTRAGSRRWTILS